MAEGRSPIDAESTNDSDRIAQKHVDLDLFFGMKESTKDVNKVTNKLV